jgi:hypothetical protein
VAATPFTQLAFATVDEASSGAPRLPNSVVPYTQQDLLDLFDRLFPNHYLAPLKDPGPGYELLQAFAKIGERLSLAVSRFGGGAFILSASGGAFATGSVQLSRPSAQPEGISVTVKAGTVVESSRSGRRYRTTADVLFGPSDLGPFTVAIQSEVQSYEYNEPGVGTAADGESLEGEIDTIVTLVEEAPSQPLSNAGTATVQFNVAVGDFQTVVSMTGASFSPDSAGRFVTFAGAANAANNGNRPIVEYIDPTSIIVRNPQGLAETTASVSWQEYSSETDVGDLTITVTAQGVPTAGGVDPALDQHGLDRNIPRGNNEADDAYRGRIRALPDNISPDAVDRAMQQLLFPIGQTYGFIETWEVQYQTCWDAPRDPIPGSPFDPNLFVYDDPKSPVPFRNRWLDLNDMRGAFVVVVPRITPLLEYGLAYDDTALVNLDFANAQGSRAVTAYDVPVTLGFGFLQGSWDGFDLTKQTLYETIFNTLEGIKAAGTSVAVELQGQ